MTKEQAKQKGFTHIGSTYGVPVYLTDDEDMNIEGTNWFNDKLLAFFVWFYVNFTNNEAFMIVKGDKL